MGLILCRLKLPLLMRRLHPVFYIVKLTAAPKDPISSWHAPLLLNSVIVDGEEKWEVERVLDSCWYYKWYQYIIK